MTPSPDRERWRLLDRLFDQALELPVEDRERFIRDACPDPETEAELRRLLVADAGAGSFLEEAPEIPPEALEGALPRLSEGTGSGGGEVPESDAQGEREGA